MRASSIGLRMRYGRILASPLWRYTAGLNALSAKRRPGRSHGSLVTLDSYGRLRRELGSVA
jgi:hypothetical protein